ncbi:MAG: UDP-3-O-acyl-N-acetylglucosamine deacetylase [Pseudomonadota bacterium]
MQNGHNGDGAGIARQRTLKSAIHCSGVGLHNGLRVSLTLCPALPDTGILFRRLDLPEGQNEIAANWRNAIETPLCTTLVGDNGATVSTIEHLMSALAGCGIDNAVVELTGSEVPIMDGSASPFLFLIDCAGTVEQAVPRRAIRILKPVSVAEESRAAHLRPGDGFMVDFEIDFENPVIARQHWQVEVDRHSFRSEIAPARTFGFLADVEKLRALGLARGGSLDNAVVIEGDRILNEGGLRFDNEFVRHKALDSIGDLYLAGAPIIGRFEGYCAGHALTLRLLRALFAEQDAWTWSDQPAVQGAPRPYQIGPSVPPQRAVATPA